MGVLLVLCLLWLGGLSVLIAFRMYVSIPGKDAGTVLNSALTLNDPAGGSHLYIGRYKYGWTLTTPYRLEMHPKDEFSIACSGGRDCLPRFQVRNIGDTEGAIWINGNNRIGSQFGPIIFAFGSFNDNGKEVARFEKNGTLVLQGDMMIDGKSLSERLAALEAR